jgi:hypothetical protein
MPTFPHADRMETQPLAGIGLTPAAMNEPVEQTGSSEDRALSAPLSSDALD